MAFEKLNKLSSLRDKKVKLIVDDGKEIIGFPFSFTETDEGEDAYLIEKKGGKDAVEYGNWPYFTEDEIISIEEIKE